MSPFVQIQGLSHPQDEDYHDFIYDIYMANQRAFNNQVAGSVTAFFRLLSF